MLATQYSAASARVWALVSGYPGKRRRGRQLLVFQVYIDDSASRDRKVFVLAGYIAPAEKWAAFSDEWQAMLDEEPRLKRFKMHEMARSGARRLRCEKFYRVIEKYVTGAISCVIHANDLAGVIDSISVPPGVKDWETLKNPYYYACKSIILDLIKHRDVFEIDEPIDFIFDMQTEQARIREGWNRMYLSETPEVRVMLGNPPSFLNDEEVKPLQAADMWAWLVRRWKDSGKNGLEGLDFRSEKFLWDAHVEMDRINVEYWKEHFEEEFGKLAASPEGPLKIARIPSDEVEAMVVALMKGQSS